MGGLEPQGSSSRWALPRAAFVSLLLHLMLLLGWPPREPGSEIADAGSGATRLAAVLRQLPNAGPPAVAPASRRPDRRAPAVATSSGSTVSAGRASVLSTAPVAAVPPAAVPPGGAAVNPPMVAPGRPVGATDGSLPSVSATPFSPAPVSSHGPAMSSPPGGSTDDALRRYRQVLESHAQRHKRYPALARERGWQGAVAIEVYGGEAGGAPQVRVVRTSGYPLLDQQARETIASAVRQVALPDALASAGFRLALLVEFRLGE